MSYSDGTAVKGQHGQEVQSNCFIRKCLLKLKLYIKKREFKNHSECQVYTYEAYPATNL